MKTGAVRSAWDRAAMSRESPTLAQNSQAARQRGTLNGLARAASAGEFQHLTGERRHHYLRLRVVQTSIARRWAVQNGSRLGVLDNH